MCQSTQEQLPQERKCAAHSARSLTICVLTARPRCRYPIVLASTTSWLITRTPPPVCPIGVELLKGSLLAAVSTNQLTCTPSMLMRSPLSHGTFPRHSEPMQRKLGTLCVECGRRHALRCYVPIAENIQKTDFNIVARCNTVSDASLCRVGPGCHSMMVTPVTL
jgi:hypothetical protein